MGRRELAKQLIKAKNAGERRRLLADNLAIADENLAEELRHICYSSWTTEPVVARKAAAAAHSLLKIDRGTGVEATSRWLDGIASITSGHFEAAASSLGEAIEILEKRHRRADAAQASVALLLALGMLGRYDEALSAGRKALEVFKRTGDQLAAGKIELNISNILSRRSMHRDSERYCASAVRRFRNINEKSWQAMAENSLANTYMELNEFRNAERYYRASLETARSMRMSVTVAEVEASLGNLALMRGDYPDALKRFEISRQLYAELDMPHQSAIAELEVADIYAELNLLPEASEIYQQVAAYFSRSRMRAEEARARLNLGRVLVRSGELRSARASLKKAHELFGRYGNPVGALAALLAAAELELSRQRPDAALKMLTEAEQLVAAAESPRSRSHFGLLCGIAALEACAVAEAQNFLSESLSLARKSADKEGERSAATFLGIARARDGDLAAAKRNLRSAIKVSGSLRSGLSSTDLGLHIGAKGTTAFTELGKLLLAEGRDLDALEVFDSARARSMLENGHAHTRDEESHDHRIELNRLYRLTETVDADERRKLAREIGRKERELAELDRRSTSLKLKGKRSGAASRAFPGIRVFRQHLDASTALIEYVELEGSIGGFVLTSAQCNFYPGLASAESVTSAMERFRFQIEAFRYGEASIARFAGQVRSRADAILKELGAALIEPLRKHLTGDRLIIVPSGPVHYVPFSALIGHGRYLIDEFDLHIAPAATVWQRLSNRRPRRSGERLLVSYADERIPMADAEVSAIEAVVSDATVINGEKATFEAVTSALEDCRIGHIACHGQFRSDNPMFSSLHLADGWVTVRDLLHSRTRANLIVLSACETGVSRVFPGEEILGLTRGFISAGARSMIASLWRVSDRAAAAMMPMLHREVANRKPPARALRTAQREMIARGEHPYAWAPFFCIGE